MSKLLKAAIITILLAPVPALLIARAAPDAKTSGDRAEVTFSGGHETDERDRGRPVVLIAAALGVPAEVFREAFTHVTPAPAGQRPTPEQERANKAALLAALAKYGVTNDRLDEVSNYYRYNRRRGELWPVSRAAAYAQIKEGKVVGFVVTNAGSGYSSPPTITVAGVPGIRGEVQLAWSQEFAKNGSIATISQPN